MYCWNCGTENEDGSKFCWKCGANLQEEENLPESLAEPEKTEKSSKKPVIIATVVCIILCLLIVGAGVLYWYLTRDTDAMSEGPKESTESRLDETEEKEGTDQSEGEAEETQNVDTVVDDIVDRWNESCSFIMGADCEKYSDDTRTDYYDKDGKAVRFSQTRDDVTLTYLFDDNENIIYISERGADNSYAYYYYQDGNLICYSKNMTRNYEPFDDAVKSSSNEYFQNGQSLLADRLISKEGSKPDDEKEDEDEKNQSDQDYILPDSSSRILSDSEVSGLSKEELRLARNEIFARHGRKFDDAQLQSYFESKSWYNGTIDPDDFSESMLSEIEKKNIELIKKYE